MRHRRFLSWSFAPVYLSIIALLAYPAAAALAESSPTDAAWQRVLEVGAYSFVADVEQTLVPRPIPANIGQTDQRVDVRLEGDVELPHHTTSLSTCPRG
jgi:hypothetical protein